MANAVLFEPENYGTIQHNVLCRLCQDQIILHSSTGFCQDCLDERAEHAVALDEGYHFAFCWGRHMSYVPIQLMYTREENQLIRRNMVCNYCANVRPFLLNNAALNVVPNCTPVPPRTYIRKYRLSN